MTCFYFSHSLTVYRFQILLESCGSARTRPRFSVFIYWNIYFIEIYLLCANQRMKEKKKTQRNNAKTTSQQRRRRRRRHQWSFSEKNHSPVTVLRALNANYIENVSLFFFFIWIHISSSRKSSFIREKKEEFYKKGYCASVCRFLCLNMYAHLLVDSVERAGSISRTVFAYTQFIFLGLVVAAIRLRQCIEVSV